MFSGFEVKIRDWVLQQTPHSNPDIVRKLAYVAFTRAYHVELIVVCVASHCQVRVVPSSVR